MTSTAEVSKEEASLYFVLFAALLATVIILSKVLHGYPRINSVLSEAALVLLIGMVAGFFVNLYIQNFVHEEEDEWQTDDDFLEEGYRVASSLLAFSPNVFFMALLPPILFNSGYQLRRELFYRHFKPIVMFACLGTMISAFCTGFSLYGISLLGWMGDFQPTLLELLTFGSLIAATDTVSVLAIFQQKRVDPRLFYLLFGESALNDAVALVLFKATSDLLLDKVNGAGSIARRSALFFAEFLCEAIGSPALGIIFGFGSALIFKHVDFRKYPELELPLYIVLLMYVPFIVAECLHLSGIVTIFFGGISARRYISPNVSKETAKNAEVIFKLAAYLAETCIFLELGLTFFGLTGSFKWAFIVWAFVAALMGRAVGIYPLALLYNCTLKERVREESAYPCQSLSEDALSEDVDEGTDGSSSDSSSVSGSSSTCTSVSPRKPKMITKRKTPLRRRDKKISPSMMHILWFSGLRGAVAYACVRDFPDVFEHNDEFIAATVVIVLGTITVMGGATEHLLRYLEVEMDVDEDDYMEKWHKDRMLNGAYHRFERKYIYRVVVREKPKPKRKSSILADDEDKVNEVEKAFQYRSSESEPL